MLKPPARTFEEALKHDPVFAQAYAGIADASIRMYRSSKEPRWAQEALAAAQQAQHLDDTLLDSQLALASVYQATGKTTEAIAILTTASQLSPASSGVFSRLGRAYLGSGKGKEAMAAYKRAINLDPYSGINYGALGAADVRLGEYQNAVDTYSE